MATTSPAKTPDDRWLAAARSASVSFAQWPVPRNDSVANLPAPNRLGFCRVHYGLQTNRCAGERIELI
jgi:hypothetical protein